MKIGSKEFIQGIEDIKKIIKYDKFLDVVVYEDYVDIVMYDYLIEYNIKTKQAFLSIRNTKYKSLKELNKAMEMAFNILKYMRMTEQVKATI